MICEVCHKEEATVFLTEIVNGVKTEKHMCNSCAAKEKSRMYSEDSFQQFLTGLLKLTGDEKSRQPKQVSECPKCGMTLDEFRKKSKLGCDTCYESFKPYVKHIVKSVHGGSTHMGKKPKRLLEAEVHKEKIDNLESELKIAIMEEDYMRAAKIRDQLTKLKGVSYE